METFCKVEDKRTNGTFRTKRCSNFNENSLDGLNSEMETTEGKKKTSKPEDKQRLPNLNKRKKTD